MFFFKQKTAYERRISDWSSDVCSSDLQMICEMIGLEPDIWPRMFEISNQLIGSRDDPDYQELPGGPEAAAMEIYALCDAVAADRRQNPRDDIMTALVQAELDGEQIGRASCRERVGQYV